MRQILQNQMNELVNEQVAKKQQDGDQPDGDVAPVAEDDPAVTSETQTIVMTNGKVTEVINQDAKNRVTRQLFVSYDLS